MDVLITSEDEKLPPEIRQLQDAGRPLPSDVSFFEEKFTLSGLVKFFALGVVLGIIGIVLMIFFVYVLFFRSPVTVYSGPTEFDWAIGGAGLAFALGGYLMFSSLRPRYRLVRDQQNGIRTRYGIFLVGDLLVSHSWFDTTIIPRPFFNGLAAGAVRYQYKGEAKSFDLPDFVGTNLPAVEQAIVSWAKASP